MSFFIKKNKLMAAINERDDNMINYTVRKKYFEHVIKLSKDYTLSEMAVILGANKNSLRTYCRRHNIDVNQMQIKEQSLDVNQNVIKPREQYLERVEELSVNHSLGEMAAILRANKNSLREYCRRHNIYVTEMQIKEQSFDVNQNVIKPRAQYLERVKELSKNHTFDEMALILGVTRNSLYNYCRRHNITVKKYDRILKEEAPKVKIKTKTQVERENLIEIVSELGKEYTVKEIAAILGLNKNNIYRFCKRHNVVTKKSGIDDAVKQYILENASNMTAKEIADYLGVTVSCIYSYCKNNEVKLKQKDFCKKNLRYWYKDYFAKTNLYND